MGGVHRQNALPATGNRKFTLKSTSRVGCEQKKMHNSHSNKRMDSQTFALLLLSSPMSIHQCPSSTYGSYSSTREYPDDVIFFSRTHPLLQVQHFSRLDYADITQLHRGICYISKFPSENVKLNKLTAKGHQSCSDEYSG